MNNIIPLFILALLINGCIPLNEPILSDTSLDNSKAYYKTYHIDSNTKISPEVAYSIESIIHTKMSALGYKPSDASPDLNILYTVYDEKLITWVPNTESLENAFFSRHDNLMKVTLKHGSIYITFFNKSAQSIVWRGFSDGYSTNPRKVRAKTYQIMDRFDVMAVPDKLISARETDPASLTNRAD